MRVRLFRSVPFLILLGLTACGFNAPEPKRTSPPPTPPIPLSTLTATFTVKANDLAQAIDAKTKSEIARIKDQPVDCGGIGKCSLNLVATRDGPVVVGAADGRLAISLPFILKAELKIKTRLFKTGAKTEAAGNIHGQTALRLGPDWRIQSNTQGNVNLANSDLRLGPISMRATQLWNNNTDHLSAPLFRTFDKHIQSDIRLKPQAQKLWHKAFQPIRVAKKPQAWLVLAPQRLRVGQLQTVNNAVVLTLGLDVRAHVVVGDQPEPPHQYPPLPPPAPLSNTPSNSFRFTVPMLLPYAQAEKLALQRLHDKPLHVKGVLVKFSELHILPSGQDVIVKTRFCVTQSWDPFGWFDSCGTGYLRGKPVFDAKAGIVRITNVHYDIATADILLATMKFLAGDELGRELETKLVFKVSSDLQKLESQIQSAMAKPQGHGVSITGTVTGFGAPTLTWTKDGFLAQLSAEGTIRADLNLGG